MTITRNDPTRSPSTDSTAAFPAAEHEPVDDRGWTRCTVPAEVTTHPDNCIMASRLRFRSSMKMTYDEYAARRNEREQVAYARVLSDAHAVLARHYDLTVEDLTRLLTFRDETARRVGQP